MLNPLYISNSPSIVLIILINVKPLLLFPCLLLIRIIMLLLHFSKWLNFRFLSTMPETNDNV